MGKMVKMRWDLNRQRVKKIQLVSTKLTALTFDAYLMIENDESARLSKTERVAYARLLTALASAIRNIDIIKQSEKID